MRMYGVTRKNRYGQYYQAQVVDSVIQYSDNDEEKIRSMQKMFGGSSKKHPTEESWKWHVGGRIADNLLSQMRPYAPMRSHQIDIHNLIYEVKDLNYRECLVDAFNHYARSPQSYPSPEEYAGLIEDPDFLRGVYAGRGADYTFEQDSPIRFWTQNISLLAALGQPYGLEPYPIVNSRIPRKEGARIPVSFRLEMNNGPKQDFLARIGSPEPLCA